jgi:hypothetical protein
VRRPAFRRTAANSRPSRVVTSIVGIALFIAAITILATRRDNLADALDAARHAPPWLITAVVLLPIANWLTVSMSLALLTRRFGHVRSTEMAALTGSAWLLNYLPMRPGMLGRMAYHKRYNNIRIKDSARVLIESLAFGGIALALLLAIAWVIPLRGVSLAAAVAAPAIIAAVVGLIRRSRLAAGFAFRYVDVLIWVARYAAVFALIGHPLSLRDAVLVASVSQIVLLLPLAGNGLGVREWAIDLAAASGLLADVVNRAAEVLVAVPVGLLCGAIVAKHLRSATPQITGHDDPEISADTQANATPNSVASPTGPGYE